MKINDKKLSRTAVVYWAAAGVLALLLVIFVNVAAAIVALLFALALWFRVNPQAPYGAALALLLLAALMTLLDQNSAARFLANWAYGFFAIGVVLHLYFYAKSEHGKASGEQQ